MMQPRMVSTSYLYTVAEASPNSVKLAREDENAPGGDENEVRREDQEKINRFSRLHQREAVLQEQLKAKQVCIRNPWSFG